MEKTTKVYMTKEGFPDKHIEEVEAFFNKVKEMELVWLDSDAGLDEEAGDGAYCLYSKVNDVEGNRICEGDIVVSVNPNDPFLHPQQPLIVNRKQGTLDFYTTMWVSGNPEVEVPATYSLFDYFLIIGNIYEHPTLPAQVEGIASNTKAYY